jgi:hypothetical protein
MFSSFGAEDIGCHQEEKRKVGQKMDSSFNIVNTEDLNHYPNMWVAFYTKDGRRTSLRSNSKELPYYTSSYVRRQISSRGWIFETWATQT